MNWCNDLAISEHEKSSYGTALCLSCELHNRSKQAHCHARYETLVTREETGVARSTTCSICSLIMQSDAVPAQGGIQGFELHMCGACHVYPLFVSLEAYCCVKSCTWLTSTRNISHFASKHSLSVKSCLSTLAS